MEVLVANAKSASALAVIRSLGRNGLTVTGASDDSRDFPLYSKYCHRKIILESSPHNIEERTEELLEIVKKRKFDVFIPVMREDLLLAVAERQDEFEKYTKTAISSYNQLKILNDKARVSALLKESGIVSPSTYDCGLEEVPETVIKGIRYPIIVKPYRGEGSEGIRIVSHPENLSPVMKELRDNYGPLIIQEFIYGEKHSAVFLLNKNSEIKRFFVHRVIREYPLNGGPACFLESTEYEPIYKSGSELLKRIGFTGMAEIEFIVDLKDGRPKIIDVNPRFYGSVHCAVVSGADFPLAVFNMALNGDLDPDPGYRKGVTCRHLLFEDTKHLINVLKGYRSIKYKRGKMKTLINYLNFMKDDSYFVLSGSDIKPALRKILYHLQIIKQ